MLRYTARWFLARTLRTVLSKYLLDIDVDSVYIPYGDAGPSKDGVGGRPAADGGGGDEGSDGGAGGWGIHLSNVRLREGVTLMTLPGRRKRVVAVRRKRRKRPRPSHVPRPDLEQEVPQQPEHGAVAMDQAPQTPMQPPPAFINENGTRDREVAVAMSPGTPGSMGLDNDGVYLSPKTLYGEECDSSYPNSDCDGVLLGSDREDDANSREFDLDLDIDDHGRSGRIMGYASPPRSAASFVSGTRTPYSTNSSPPTPTGPSWACFARGGREGAARGASVPTGAVAVPDKERILLPDDTLVGTEEGTSSDAALPPIRPLPSTGYHVETLNGIEAADEYGESTSCEKEKTDDDNEEDYEYYEEESTIEETMELRVGHGGRIGTLHAKIVGKDYHIKVEDADLILEIAPKTTSGTDNAGAAGAGGAVTADDVEEAERSTSATSMKGNASSTTEDRVMQNSRLARYLAAIPNLYLRDCRVKIVLKGGDSTETGADANKGTDANNYETATTGEGEDNAEENTSSTTYIVGIDFLSVTGGEDDFLAHDRTPQNDQMHSAPSFREGAIDDAQNDFLRKRVRTGKGPEGGIFIQVISPLQDKRRYPQYYAGRTEIPRTAASQVSPSQVGTRWAVKTFASATDMCLLRLSGLDVSARILLGRRREVEAAAAIETSTNRVMVDDSQDYYFDYDGELVMMGNDYFSAGVAPNNDGILDHMEKGVIVEDEAPNDEIETIPIPSNFHRISRGMRRHGCKEHTHLPPHDCSQCWSYTVQSSEEKYEIEEDAVMPLPGLVLYFAITDPIELNIERQGLESLNALKALFSSGGTGSSQDAKTGNDETDSTSASNDNKVSAETGCSANNSEENDFHSFMKPEAVHVVGVHLASVCLRLQAMKNDGTREDGLAFSYWEMQLGALTVDSQNLNAKELAFKDMRISIGQILLYELRGICRKRLVRLGLDPVENTNAATPLENSSVPPQLCTAATILGVSSSFDALRLLHRYENAVHFRFVNIPVSSEISPIYGVPMGRRCIDIKLGSIDADLPPGFNSALMTAKNEATAIVLGSATKESDHGTTSNASISSKSATPPPPPPPPPSLLEYTARLDGGKFNMRPRIKCAFPATTLSGQSSSDEGFSIHSVLNRVKFEYGKRNRSDVHPSQARSNTGIQKFAQLPEACRMGVLFYLEELKSLEKALGMKENPTHFFLRCRNISQRLGQMAAMMTPSEGPKELKTQGRKVKHSKAKTSSSSSASSSKSDRKRHLLEKLKSLSVDELEVLLAAHERNGCDK